MLAYRMERDLETVRPGDVVLDVGCGSGILGLFACQAGAGRVYAVDRSDIVPVAAHIAKANGYADRIIYLNKDIKDVSLDEKVDVIVSELISKGGIGQNMAEIIGWCRDHLLKPDRKLLTEQVELYVAPVEDSEIYSKVKLPYTSE